MILSELHLNNFRNYDHLDLTFHPNLNLFVGQNAQGKTNIAESIYFLALTRSHRTHTDRELIAWDQKEMSVSGTILKKKHNRAP
jgi:DNA replication and repair protein RecF